MVEERNLFSTATTHIVRTGLVLLALATAIAWPDESSPAAASAPTATTPNFKVAFIGDQSVGANAAAVLKLIANEGADMVLHQGDLGYGDETDPQRAIDWDAQVTAALGADFPYFASIGNHDVGNWSTYQQLLEDRLALVLGASCTGEYGVKSACTYQGLFFILSGVGTTGTGHTTYITDELTQDTSIWRVCTWHKNQNAMQVGSKLDEAGWEPYEACREGGAIVATGHEHSYSRTKTLTNLQSQSIDQDWPAANTLRVSNGSTFVFVSGLGGRSIRDQDRCLPATPPYGCNGEWASIYTSDQGATYGALFIEFNVNGEPDLANGYFKNISGATIDTFTVRSQLAKPVGGVAEQPGAADADAEFDDARSSGTNAGPLISIAAAALAVALGGAAWRVRRRAGRNSHEG